MPSPRACPTCAAPAPTDGARFCGRCGEALPGGRVDRPAEAPPDDGGAAAASVRTSTDVARRGLPRSVLAAAVIVLLAGLAWLGGALDSTSDREDASDPDDVVDLPGTPEGTDGDAAAASQPDASDDSTESDAAGPPTPACTPSPCLLWRYELTSDDPTAAASARDRIAFADGRRLVVLHASLGTPLADTDLDGLVADLLVSRPDLLVGPDMQPTSDETGADTDTVAAPIIPAVTPSGIVAASDRLVVALQDGGDPTWLTTTERPVRGIEVAGDTLVLFTEPDPQVVSGRGATGIVGLDAGTGTAVWSSDTVLVALRGTIAVTRDTAQVAGIDLTTGERRWERPLDDVLDIGTGGGAVLLQRDRDGEVLDPETGAALWRYDGVATGAAETADGAVLVTVAPPGSPEGPDEPALPAGAAVAAAVTLVGPDGEPRWSRSLAELLPADAPSGPPGTVPCCPRLLPTASPAGVLLEILDEIGVVLSLGTGEVIADGPADALQRELFSGARGAVDGLTVQRFGDTWDLRGPGRAVRVSGVTTRVADAPLVFRGGDVLLAVRPVAAPG